MTYITGFHGMEEAIRSGNLKGASLFVSSPGPRIKRIMEEAQKKGVQLKRITAAELDRLAPDNRGAALGIEGAASAPAIDLSEWCSSLRAEKATVLLLDHIEDPHNYGAILRSADVFACDLVVVPERRAAGQTDAVARASAGALSYVPVAEVSNLARALELLKAAGFWSYAADMGGQSLEAADLPKRMALVLGAEGNGVSRLLKERCDGILSIPQFGHVDSLNVSVAAGIFLYALKTRQA
jgi:23S rRNA (guanosine2251-2'-O)-methyltransferase